MKEKLSRIFVFVCMISVLLLGESRIEKIQQAIIVQNASWQAGENAITKLSRDEFRRMLGTTTDFKPIDGEAKLIELPQVGEIPENFDWRNSNGNWVTPVRNQGGCGSCWDFSAVAQIEAWWKIHYEMPDSNIDLSEQYILSCGSVAGSCEGGWPHQALDFVKDYGITYEKYMMYQANDQIPCENTLKGWDSNMVTIPGWGYITLEEAQVINIKNALMHHPVSASYDVYEDFRYYNGGVYDHTFGEYEGGHAVLIVGWEDENECWIVKNSWGPYWGENGYFRIKWGSCNMGKNMPFIYEEIVSDVQLSFSQDTVMVEVSAGDAISENISITNVGTQSVELYASDSQNPILFHQSSNSAYDGMSWWCGISEVGGYENHWLQYLETPVIDLSNATSPQLDFMAKWSVEGSYGAEAPFDGWDGWNIWISTDNGANYAVLIATSPQYNNTSLWSFGHAEQGWDMGAGVAGFSGYSNQWEPVNCDLSSYVGSTVKLKFAFASDMGYATPEDGTLEGLFLDNIKVSDGENLIFADYADAGSEMNLIGFGDLPNDWLDIYYDNNRIEAGNAMNLSLTFNAPNKAGTYNGMINFLANNDNAELPQVPVQMVVDQAYNDVSIDDIILPSTELIGAFKNPIGVVVSNNGLNDISNLVLSISNDTYHKELPFLQSGSTEIVWISEYVKNDSEELEITVSADFQDEIMANNSLTKSFPVGDLLDNFEHYNNNWEFNNWVYSNSDAYDGLYCITSFIGTEPSVLSFEKPFEFNNINFNIKFSAKVSSGSAALKVEYRSGEEDWKTGNLFEIDSTDYAEYEGIVMPEINTDSTWIRLSATSNQNTTIFLDNISVSTATIEAIEEQELTSEKFQLNQNFPNPFNPTTSIEYNIPQRCDVKLAVYDISGNLVEMLVNDNQHVGTYQVKWNAENYASGIYFYRLQAGEFTKTSKMILMK